MLYLFFGEDVYRSRERLREFLECFLLGNSRSFSLTRFDSDNFDKVFFEEIARGSNIFGGNCVIVCEGLFENSDSRDFFTENLKSYGKSENIFVFWEEKLSEPALGILKKHAEKIEEFKFLSPREVRNWLKEEAKRRKITISAELEKNLIENCGTDLNRIFSELDKYALAPNALNLELKKEEINIFKITDALIEKNKSKAWLIFQEALLSGVDVEEIFWKLVWQIKNLLIVKSLLPLGIKEISKKARLHPFVVQKAVYGSRNFKDEEISRHSLELIDLYHRARRGLTDFETGIEKFLIKL